MQRIFQNLPLELYEIIRDYLITFDYWQWMNCSQEIFGLKTTEIKSRTIQLRGMINYNNEKTYQEEIQRIHSRLKDPSKQFILWYRGSSKDSWEYLYENHHLYSEIHLFTSSKLCRTTTSNLRLPDSLLTSLSSSSYSSSSSASSSSETVDKEWLKIINKKKSLTLAYDDSITSEALRSGFQYLEGRTTLRLCCCPYVNSVTGLEKLYSLTLESLRDSIDFTCFDHPNSCLHSLTLWNHTGKLNLQGLGNIYYVKFTECSGIKDVSPLTGNHTVVIGKCLNIELGLEILKNSCKDLTIDMDKYEWLNPLPRNMKKIKVSYYLHGQANPTYSGNFTNLFQFCLSSNWYLEEIPNLTNIPVVILEYCDKITNLSNRLGNNKSVTISSCRAITDFSVLKNNIHKVIIKCCSGFANGYDLCENVKELKINQCHYISDISMLGKVETLQIHDCSIITSLEGLGEVPYLEVLGCRNVTSLKGVGQKNGVIATDVSSTDEEEELLLKDYLVHSNHTFPVRNAQLSPRTIGKVYFRKVIGEQK